MLKLFDIFKNGLVTLLTSPFWIIYLVFKLVYCLIVYIINLVKAVFYFFKGKSLFNSREDRAIQKLKEEDLQELNRRRDEAMKNADVV